MTGTMPGTLLMAPESLKGEPIDGRTDLYALGCIMYELLTSDIRSVAPTIRRSEWHT
ncbi:MAG: hypothetical protein R3E66_05065 [bacterium]